MGKEVSEYKFRRGRGIERLDVSSRRNSRGVTRTRGVRRWILFSPCALTFSSSSTLSLSYSFSIEFSRLALVSILRRVTSTKGRDWKLVRFTFHHQKSFAVWCYVCVATWNQRDFISTFFPRASGLCAFRCIPFSSFLQLKKIRNNHLSLYENSLCCDCVGHIISNSSNRQGSKIVSSIDHDRETVALRVYCDR